MLSFAVWGLYALDLVRASVTIYGQIPIGATSISPTMTVAAAYNDTILNPPPVPNSGASTAFTLNLPSANTSVSGLSIQLPGAWFGFSIEMSVMPQVLGKNSSYLQVPFLNLMENIVQRAGSVHVRCGGNTQDYAYYVDTLPEGKSISKESASTTNPTQTPAVIFNMDMFYLLANISSLVNVKWYLGVPFNDTTNWRLQIAEFGEAILGDNLIGLQAANEPDLYADHGHRPAGYNAWNYFGEFGELVAAFASNDNIPIKNILIGPSIATGDWTPEDVWNTGFIPAYKNNLTALAVEHYPTDNCFALYGIGSFVDPQTEFPDYLNHTASQWVLKQYLNSTSIAVENEIPFLMFETNSASCGGFYGISDSFGGALWALDYGLQMAYSNFSGALLHVGGQNVFYNVCYIKPSTSQATHFNGHAAPPSNQSSYYEWTIGAVYYSALIMAEVTGSTNTSQIIDLEGNDANIYTPQYAIYENGELARVAFFNYITDPSGDSDYTATIAVSGGTVPSSVKVKYFLSDSVSTKNNITWAGQTFGTIHTVDGRLKNDLSVTTINCDTSANTCNIPVPAPAFALVFMSDSYYGAATPNEITYSTSTQTKTGNTATIDSAVLATSNGMSGKDWAEDMGSTSSGSVSGASSIKGSLRSISRLLALPAVGLVTAVVFVL